eukprot:scaffold60937_cov40-Tisochrysis_lutea.AAC.1
MEEPHKTGDTGRRHRRRMEQRETGSGNIPSMGDKAKQRATGDSKSRRRTCADRDRARRRGAQR